MDALPRYVPRRRLAAATPCGRHRYGHRFLASRSVLGVALALLVSRRDRRVWPDVGGAVSPIVRRCPTANEVKNSCPDQQTPNAASVSEPGSQTVRYRGSAR